MCNYPNCENCQEYCEYDDMTEENQLLKGAKNDSNS